MKTVMTIAGSDSGGGAGIQADLKAFAANGVHGTSAITAITAQNTVAVTDVLALPPSLVANQIDAIIDDIGADAVKTGMLPNAAIIETVADRIRAHSLNPVVIDPVMVTSSGTRLLEDAAVEAIRSRLMPLATLVTPNTARSRRAHRREQIVTRRRHAPRCPLSGRIDRCSAPFWSRVGTSTVPRPTSSMTAAISSCSPRSASTPRATTVQAALWHQA